VPRVSVVLPAYNYAHYIGEAIESALAQTYRDREIIVVDDGSTDGTIAVLERFGSRIIVSRHTNRGLAATRNAGIRLAGGEYVALIDADDVWEAQHLERTVERLDAADESIVGAFSGWVMIDAGGRVLRHTQRVRHGAFGIGDFLHLAPFPPSTVVLRRAAVRNAGMFDETIPAAEDWDMWLRLTAAGGSFVAVERCLCRYRVHGTNMSRDPDSMRAGGLRALEKLFATPTLGPAVRAQRAAAFAHVQARASSQLYASGRAEEGAAALAEAVREWPDILLEDETHWAVICADQPPGYKGSAHLLDLARGEDRIIGALESAVVDPALRRRAQGRAYRALAQLAYGQRRMATARGYVRAAIAADAALWSDRGMIGTFVKSLAGGRTIEALSGWRRRHESV
jgi:GT2 family glycosyltransferase